MTGLKLRGHGIGISVPRGWEGRIFRRTPEDAQTQEHGTDHPVAHLANFPLPVDRGDFGSGAVDRMTAQHAFVSLLEYGPDCAGTALFTTVKAVPRLNLTQFDPNKLQRRIAGQLGTQQFFTLAGRAFCLYVVLGSHQHGARLVAEAREILSTVEVTA